ncbi:hypothetical protein E4Z66_17775 [Aliishimia ponticola]|uniref:AB hydrolase-1 domain-containing protein n=1 Tax=Aliishimia ponticola TaxID=2499833 RepID=A0A4S4NFG1_9RHOB|nr:alpha/beta fold hydrolase [Aliishimia ponticola]THH34810.1 hypothetical protein E4Z66_17775 [Aliishimia ponticola]
MMEEITDYTGPGRLLRLASDGVGLPVLLTHGTFSNAATCAPLASYLAGRGHPVYVAEWRGRGGQPGRFDFHDLAEGEIASALRHLRQIGPLHLVAHSGGGLALTFASMEATLRPSIASLSLIATQATHLTDARRVDYWGVRFWALWGRIFGYWPARRLGLGPCNESSALLSHWLAFNRARRITDRTGADIFPGLAMLDLPVLALAGAADHTIARPDGCRTLAQAFGPSAQFHLCDAVSDGEDFTHARLFKSRAAERSVWPRLARFFAQVEGAGRQ